MSSLDDAASTGFFGLLVFAASFIATALLCAAALPFLRSVFLVTPGERSSHIQPTPQGGGLIVVPVALLVAWSVLPPSGWRPYRFEWSLLAAMIVLTALGSSDDLKGLSARLRFLVQAIAAGLVLATLPAAPLTILEWSPPILAGVILLLGALWFINLTNFMDGLDLMSVAQFVPAFATVFALFLLDPGKPGASPIVAFSCLAFAGALLGFATLNRPPARLFLGDSGSLPLGLLGASAALVTAGQYGIIVAGLPFLYYCADATLTLARRGFAGEKVWEAHKQHFYQRGLQRGLSAPRIIARVVACNVALCVAALVVRDASAAAHLAALAFGIIVVGLLLRDLSRERE
jgi:UDP-N-acetylmuramyl pentapeptide phosphotransferase/UDP-N-acetylglucosamine-1-phosphate transferase